MINDESLIYVLVSWV